MATAARRLWAATAQNHRLSWADWKQRRSRPSAPPGTTCVYCDGPGETWDHVIPRSRGGANHKRNLRRACRPCNQAKGDVVIAGVMPEPVHRGSHRLAPGAVDWPAAREHVSLLRSGGRRRMCEEPPS